MAGTAYIGDEASGAYDETAEGAIVADGACFDVQESAGVVAGDFVVNGGVVVVGVV